MIQHVTFLSIIAMYSFAVVHGVFQLWRHSVPRYWFDCKHRMVYFCVKLFCRCVQQCVPLLGFYTMLVVFSRSIMDIMSVVVLLWLFWRVCAECHTLWLFESVSSAVQWTVSILFQLMSGMDCLLELANVVSVTSQETFWCVLQLCGKVWYTSKVFCCL